MAEKKSQKKDPIVYAGREIETAFSLSVEEAHQILSDAIGEDVVMEPVRRVAEERLVLVEKCSEAMVEGWSIQSVNAFRNKHGLTRRQMESLELDARKVLTDSYSGLQRQDLVARQLSRLELISKKAMETNAMSTAQACVTTILKTIGADRPEE